MASYVNTLAECIAIEEGNLKKVTPKYSAVAQELAIMLASDGGAGKVHVYMCAAQDSTANGDAWNLTRTHLTKALKKLPDPLYMSAWRDFRPTHRDKSPLFSLARIAELNAAKKENAAAAKVQAEQAEAAAAQDRAAAAAAADASTTPDMIASVAIATADRLGLDLNAVADCVSRKANPAQYDFHNVVDMVVSGRLSGTKEILDTIWAGFSDPQRNALFRLCGEAVPAKTAPAKKAA